MTEETPVTTPNPMGMIIETNSAPVEQRSTEMVTTEPKTPVEELDSTTEVEAPKKPTVETAPALEANETARRAFEAEIQAENYKRQLDALQPKKELGPRPNIGDFDTLEKYEAALESHFKAEANVEFENGQTLKQQQAEQLKVQAAVREKGEASRLKHSDFDQIVKPLAGVLGSIPILNDFVAKNPMGTEVLYELAKQPALIESLRGADMWAAGEMLINMAARLKAPKPAEFSNAPEPIKTVGSREAVKPKITDLAVKDINGYMAKMNKAELARKRSH